MQINTQVRRRERAAAVEEGETSVRKYEEAGRLEDGGRMVSQLLSISQRETDEVSGERQAILLQSVTASGRAEGCR